MLKKIMDVLGGRASPESGPMPAGNGARILVTDDDHDIRTLLSLLLEARGYTVITASNGRDGLETARRERPDAIILDGNMPQMDGLEALRQLRRSERTRRIPVIMLTMRSREGDVLTGLRHGAQDYLTKPVVPEELFNSLKTVLEQHR